MGVGGDVARPGVFALAGADVVFSNSFSGGDGDYGLGGLRLAANPGAGAITGMAGAAEPAPGNIVGFIFGYAALFSITTVGPLVVNADPGYAVCGD